MNDPIMPKGKMVLEMVQDILVDSHPEFSDIQCIWFAKNNGLISLDEYDSAVRYLENFECCV